MGKTLVISLEELNINGDILDIGGENISIIYNVAKELEDEIAVDYADGDDKRSLIYEEYDACTIFFNLNSIWPNNKIDSLMKEVWHYLKENGEIYIWDVNKDRGEFINNDIKVLMPNGNIKEINLKNINPLASINIEMVEKILEKRYDIEDKKEWMDMFFIKGRKRSQRKKREEEVVYENFAYSY